MKLCELHLRAFGSFENNLLRFDSAKPLQVLYGPNEAGKTTFSRAFVSLIYGLSKKTTDNYLFPLEHLFIEGLFQSEHGKYFRIIREKKNSKKTTDSLRPFFPTVGREAFINSYILNHETLQKGSENLLKFLGQFNLEFLESKGISTIKQVMNELEEQKKMLFKERGRNPVINTAFTRYSELESQKEQLELKVEQFEILQEEKRKLLLSREAIEREVLNLKKNSEAISVKEKFLNVLNAFQIEMQKFRKVKGEVDQHSGDNTLLKRLPNPEQFWVENKSLLNSFQQLEHELQLETKNLLNEKKCLNEALAHPKGVENQERLKKLEAGYSEVAESAYLQNNYETLSSELKHQERMIARLSRELAITADIRDILSQKEPYSSPDLRPLEKKYQELKVRWQVYEKNLRSVTKEISAYEQKMFNAQNKAFDLELLVGKRLLRSNLENSLDKEIDFLTFKEAVAAYIKVVHEESAIVDVFLRDAEAFADYQKEKSLLAEAKQSFSKLKQEEKELLAEREKFEGWMSRFSFSKNFSFHEFGLFRLFMERVEKLMKRISQYHEDLKNEALLLEKIAVLKERVHCLLEIAGLPTNGSLHDSFASLDQWVTFQKKQLLEAEKKQSKVDHLQSQIKEKEEKIQEIKESQNHLYNQLFETHPNQTLKKIEVLPLKKQIEEFLSQNLLLIEAQKKTNALISQLEQIQQELGDDFDPVSETFYFKNFEDSSLIEIRAQSEKNTKLNETVQIQLQEKYKALSSLDNQIGQIDFQLSKHAHKEQKIRIEKSLKDSLFEIEEGIQEYLIHDTALHVLSNIAKEYQDEHQAEVLKLASNYFKILTLEKYNSISIDMIHEGSFLIVEGLNGSVGMDSLSLGTRVQLYLALKLAFIEIQNYNKEPFPILLDDLFVQFDDERATAGLRLLEKLSEKRQIFFLTHHSHLLNLIEKNLDSKVYDLQPLRESSQIV